MTKTGSQIYRSQSETTERDRDRKRDRRRDRNRSAQRKRDREGKGEEGRFAPGALALVAAATATVKWLLDFKTVKAIVIQEHRATHKDSVLLCCFETGITEFRLIR